MYKPTHFILVSHCGEESLSHSLKASSVQGHVLLVTLYFSAMPSAYCKLYSFFFGNILNLLLPNAGRLRRSSLFHILSVKTNYEEFLNLKRIGKNTEKSSINPIVGCDQEDMK